jgi:hypothetical protein
MLFKRAEDMFVQEPVFDEVDVLVTRHTEYKTNLASKEYDKQSKYVQNGYNPIDIKI